MADLSTPGFLDALSAARAEDDVVLATMTAGFLWNQHSRSDRDFAYIAPMGSVSSVALGLSLARPDLTVIAVDGDGSLLMNLGTLVTIGGSSAAHLLHIVLENDGYAITGMQPLPGHGTANLIEMAKATGYRRASRLGDIAELSEAIDAAHEGGGPSLLAVPVTPAFDGTRLAEWTHGEQAERTQGPAGFQNLRKVLASTKP
jgi:thiamine pyrophosphate-dependent acetolactate synthase large subunit-like protein